MTISPFVLLIVYLVGVALFLILSILSVYHIIRFGFSKKLGLTVTIIYFIMVVLVLIVTFSLLNQIDWSEPMELEIPFIENNNAGNQ